MMLNKRKPNNRFALIALTFLVVMFGLVQIFAFAPNSAEVSTIVESSTNDSIGQSIVSSVEISNIQSLFNVSLNQTLKDNGDGTYSLFLNTQSSIRHSALNEKSTAAKYGYFKANYEGDYLFELWGGDGGYGQDSAYSKGGNGGKGGYIYAVINMKKGDYVFYTIGGNGQQTVSEDSGGGANGDGGDHGEKGNFYVGGGGGYTAVYLFNGDNVSTFESTYLNSGKTDLVKTDIQESDRIDKYVLIAGGGGGAGAGNSFSLTNQAIRTPDGGAGGSLTSSSGTLSGSGYPVEGTYYVGADGISSGTSQNYIGYGGSNVPGAVNDTFFSFYEGKEPNDWMGTINTEYPGGSGGAGNFRGGAGGAGYAGGSGGIMTSQVLGTNVGGGGGGSSFVAKIASTSLTTTQSQYLVGENGNESESGGAVYITYIPTAEQLKYVQSLTIEGTVSNQFDIVGFTATNATASTSGNKFTVTGVDATPGSTTTSDITLTIKPVAGFMGGNDVPILSEQKVNVTSSKGTYNLNINDKCAYVNVPYAFNLTTNNYVESIDTSKGESFTIAANKLYNETYDTDYSSTDSNYAYITSVSTYSITDGTNNYNKTDNIVISTQGAKNYTISFTVTPKLGSKAVIGDRLITKTFSSISKITIVGSGEGTLNGNAVKYSKKLTYDSTDNTYIFTANMQTEGIYDKTESVTPSTTSYDYSSNTGGTISVAKNGDYYLQVWGGNGGKGGQGKLAGKPTGTPGNGGSGGYVGILVHLKTTDTITYVVGKNGQVGDDASSGWEAGDQGQGGKLTSVYINGTKVIVAGGGGGGGGYGVGTVEDGKDCTSSGEGTDGSPSTIQGDTKTGGAAGTNYKITLDSSSSLYPNKSDNVSAYTSSNYTNNGGGAFHITYLSADPAYNLTLTDYEIDTTFDSMFQLVSSNPITVSGASSYNISGTNVTNIVPTENIQSNVKKVNITVSYKLKTSSTCNGGNDIKLLQSLYLKQADKDGSSTNDSITVAAKNETDYANVKINESLLNNFTLEVNDLYYVKGQTGINKSSLIAENNVPTISDPKLVTFSASDSISTLSSPLAPSETTAYLIETGVKPAADPEKAIVGPLVTPISLSKNAVITVIYNVTYDLFNISTSAEKVTINGDSLYTATPSSDYSVKLTANTGWILPAYISVSIDGSPLSSSSYTYNKTSGELTIPAASVTGNISISATATADDKDYYIYYLHAEDVGMISFTEDSVKVKAGTTGSALTSKIDELLAKGPAVGDTSKAGYTYTIEYPDGDEITFMPAYNVWINGYYAPNRYTLTINYVNESGTPIGTQVVEDTTICYYTKAFSYQSPEVAGYAPSYVKVDDVESSEYDENVVSGTMPSNDLTINVVYKSTAGQIVVLYSMDDGTKPTGFVERKELSGTAGTSYTPISTPVIEGYNASASTCGTGTFSSAGEVYYVNYTPKSYVVTFNSDGGTAFDNRNVYYNQMYGYTGPSFSNITFEALPKPVKVGYTFGGWFIDSAKVATTEETVFTGSSDVTLTAKWTAQKFSVTIRYFADYGSPSLPSSITYSGTLEETYEQTSHTNVTGYMAPAPVAETSFVAYNMFIDLTYMQIDAITISPTSYYYTGSAITPTSITVKLKNGTTLTKGTDYTVEYSDNTDAGSATATVTFIGSGSGTATADYTISKAQPAAAPTITIDYKEEKTNEKLDDTYEYSPDDGVTWISGTDPASEIELEPGKTYKFRKKGDDNHEPGTETTITIPSRPSTPEFKEKTPTSITIKNTDDDQEYSIDGGETWIPGTNGDLTFDDLKSGTNYEIITRIKEDGTTPAGFPCENPLEVKTAIIIASADIIVDSIPDETYTGSQITPEPKVTFDGLEKTKGTHFTYSYGTNINAGTNAGSVVITLINDYSGTKTVYFNILKATNESPTAPDVTPDFEEEQTEEKLDDTYEYSPDGGENWYPCDGTETPLEPDDEEEKTYKFRKKGDDNHNPGEETTIIVPARPEAPSAPTFVDNTPDSITIENDEELEYSIDGGTTWLSGTGDELTFNGLETNEEYEIIARKKATNDTPHGNPCNPGLKAKTVIELTEDDITITVNAGNTISYVYDKTKKEPAVAIKIKDPETPLTLNTDYKVAYSDNENVGQATITITFINKYKSENPLIRNFDITQREVGLTWSESFDDLVFDGDAKVLTATATNVCTGDTCNVTVDVTTYKDNVNVGTFTYTATELDNSNYKLPSNVTSDEYTITKKTLEDDKDNQEESNIQVTFDGTYDYIYDKTAKTPSIVIKIVDIEKELASTDYSVSYTNNINAGTATITIKFLSTGNYSGDDITRDFTIEKREVGLTWSESFEDLVFDGDAKVLTATATNVCTGDTCNVTVAVTTDKDNVNVGSFTYTATGLGDSNYKLPSNVTSAEYTITKKTLEDDKDNQEESNIQVTFDGTYDYIYDKTAKTPSIVIKIVDIEKELASTDYSVTYTNNVNAGTATITIKFLSTGNYSGDDITRDFTIEKREVGLTWSTLSDAELVFDGDAKVLTATATNVCTDDTCNVTVAVTTDKDNVNVGSFTYTATGLGDSNYKLPSNVTSSEYTITKKTLEDDEDEEESNIQVTFDGTYNYVYTGTEKTPSIVIKIVDIEKELASTDYSVTYTNNVNAGTATITIKFLSTGNYSGDDITRDFTIEKATIKAEIKSVDSKEFDNTTNGSGTLGVTDDTKVNNEEPVIVGTFTWANVDAGTTSLTVTDIQLTDDDINKNYVLDSSIISLTYTASSQNDSKIEKSTFDSANIKWDYTSAYDYNALSQSVYLDLDTIPAGVTVDSYSNNTKINAGSYTASAVLDYDQDNFENVLIVENLNWVINKIDYDMTNAKWDYTSAFNYDASVKTVKVIGLPDGVSVLKYYNNEIIVAGSYIAYVTFSFDTINYNEPTLADLNWEIKKASYDMSNAKWNYTSAFNYDGLEKSVEVVGLPEGVSILKYSNNLKTNAGDYKAIAVFNYDVDNYEAPVIDDLIWTINKIDYDMSGVTFVDTEVYYDGQPHSIAIGGTLPVGIDGISIVVSYSEGLTELGTKEIVAAFTVKSGNYNEIVPMKANLTIKEQYSKSEKIADDKGLVVVESEDGIPSDIVIYVELKAQPEGKDSGSGNELTIDDQLGFGEAFGEVYSIKIMRNGEEIQPSDIAPGTVLTVKMKVPESMVGKDFRILHIHNNDDISVIRLGNKADIGTYIIDEEGNIVTKINKFSEFAFVYKVDCIAHWFLLAMLIAFVIFVAVFIKLTKDKEKKNKLIPIIGCAVFAFGTILAAFFGTCYYCIIMTIVNGFALIAAIFLFANIYSNKNKSNDGEPVVKYIETIKEVPVEKQIIIEKVVEKPVETIVEKIVEVPAPVVEETKSEEVNEEPVIEEQVVEQELSLSDSMAKAQETVQEVVINKEVVASWLEDNYKDVVTVNRRENFTKTGLPLADTHYIDIDGKNKCFIYVYEVENNCFFLVRSNAETVADIKTNHPIYASAFPKTRDNAKWFTMLVDDSYKTTDEVFDELKKVIDAFGNKEAAVVEEPVVEEELSLSDSMAKAQEIVQEEVVINKDVVASWLEDNYKDVVTVNRRENFTKTGLPLADTHYIDIDGKNKCFIYVYEVENNCFFLVRSNNETISSIKESHPIYASAFPKTRDNAKWYTMLVDDTYKTTEEVFNELRKIVESFIKKDAPDDEEGLSLSDSMAKAQETVQEVVINKEVVASWLDENYKEVVTVNRRENFTKTGLPLADTHYIDIDGKNKCFIYVYEVENNCFFLVRSNNETISSIKENHPIYASAFPKTRDNAKWFTMLVDDSYKATEEVFNELRKIVESFIKKDAPDDEEGLSLSDSMAKAQETVQKVVINKEVVASWLEDNYKDVVTVNRRENFTKTGLPLADTHYIDIDGKNKCFIYVYEVENNCFFLVRSNAETVADIKTNHPIYTSAFPKTRDNAKWFTMLVDDSYKTTDEVFDELRKVIDNLNKNDIVEDVIDQEPIIEEPVVEEELSLSDSMAKAQEIVQEEVVINKEVVASWLEDNYKDVVTVNRRENFTKTGLPLADTHYIDIDGKNKCFIYVYEVENNCFFLVRSNNETISSIKESHPIYASAFPKTRDNAKWFTMLVDDSYKSTEEVFNELKTVIEGLNKKEVVEVIAEETVVDEIVEEGLSLSDSMAKAQEIVQEEVEINKDAVASWLDENYKNVVTVNRRENFTKTGLPLADTHYIDIDGKNKCFIYVYEVENNCFFLVRSNAETVADIKTNHPIYTSAFPKTRDNAKWFTMLIDDSYKSNEEVFNELKKVIDNLNNKEVVEVISEEQVKEDKEELSLSESMAKAQEIVQEEVVVNKEVIANWLNENYKDVVIVNRRENFTKTGLPLADTHYININGKNKCFIYVYEVENNCFFLVRTSAEIASDIKIAHPIYASAFPKTRDDGKWFTMLIDDSYKSTNELYDELRKIIEDFKGQLNLNIETPIESLIKEIEEAYTTVEEVEEEIIEEKASEKEIVEETIETPVEEAAPIEEDQAVEDSVEEVLPINEEELNASFERLIEKEPEVDSYEGNDGVEVVGVCFEKRKKVYKFSPNGAKYEVGQKVEVDTVNGIMVGIIVHKNYFIDPAEHNFELKNVLRLFTGKKKR